MKSTIKILLQTKSPLHIAHPDNMRMTQEGAVTWGDKIKTFPCTAIQKMKIMVPPVNSESSSDNASEGVNADTAPKNQRKSATAYHAISFPVIASNNLAGRMRRHAAKHVLEAIKAKGQKVSLHAYSILMTGASTGRPDSDNLTYAEHVQSRSDPYFGLFGGGPKMFRRNMIVHPTLPITKETTKLKGSMAHPLASDNMQAGIRGEGDYTLVHGFRHLDDLNSLANVELASATIENFENALLNRQSKILTDKSVRAAKANGEEADGESDGRNSAATYSSIEFVVPGVIWDMTMELNVKTQAQVGLFLETLDSFAANERLGGYVRNGFGVFEMLNVVMENENSEPVQIFQNGRLNRAEDTVAVALDAWQAAAKLIDVESIEKLLYVVSDDDRKAKATAKKTKKAVAALEAEAAGE